jgi:hypothetical protein
VPRPSPLCRIPASELARCLSGTIGAAGGRCVRLDVRGGSVAFVVKNGSRVYAAEAEVEQSVDDAEVVIHSSEARRMLAVARRHGDEPAQLVRVGNTVALTVGREVVAAEACRCDGRPWRSSVPCRRSQPTKIVAADFLEAVASVANVSLPGDLLQIVFSTRFVKVASMAGKSAACPALGTAVETVLHVDPRHLRGWVRTLSPEAVVTVDPGDGRVPAVFSHDDALAVVPVAVGSGVEVEEPA